MGSEWTESTLEELSSSVSYGYTESASSEKIGPHFLRITDIQNGVVNWDSVPYCPITEKDHLKYRLNEGDIVVARTGNSTGENFIFEGNHDAVFASYLIRFAIDENLAHPKFVWYSMRSPSWWAFVNGSKTGSAQAGANAKVLGRFPVDLPPLPEQKAIAHILGTLDDKIELNRRMNATLEGMAQALFKSWFVDFDPVIDNALAAGNPIPDELASRAEVRKAALASGTTQQGSVDHPTLSDPKSLFPAAFQFTEELGWIPEGWVVQEIRDRTESIQYGLTQSASEQKCGPKFLRITDIRGGAIDWNSVPYCEIPPEQYEKYRINEGDIFVARTGASTGENVYVTSPKESVFASYLVRFTFEDRSIGRLVGMFMRSPKYFDHIEGILGGSAQPNASAQALASATMVFPDPDVAKLFFSEVSAMDDRKASNDHETQTLTKLRDTLLPKLISGELHIPGAVKLAEEIAV